MLVMEQMVLFKERKLNEWGNLEEIELRMSVDIVVVASRICKKQQQIICFFTI